MPDSTVVFVEISLADLNDVLRSDIVDSLQIGIDIVETVQRFDLAEQNGLIECPLARQNEMRLDLVFRAIQFVRGDSVCFNVSKLIIDARFNFIDRVLTTRFRANVKKCRILGLPVFGGYERDGLFPFNHSLIQACSLSFGEDDCKNLQSVSVGMRDFWHVIRDCEARDFRTPPDQDASLTTLGRFMQDHRARLRAGWNGSEGTIDFLQNVRGVEIADNDKGRIVRMVVTAVVGLLAFDGGAFDILQPSDDRTAIGMDLVSRRFELLKKKAPWGIQTRLQFLDDNFLLRLELLRIECTAHHPVRFHVQSDFPSIGGKTEVVRRKIVRRKRIVSPAILQSKKIDLALLETFGTFEQHVLEEVGLACVAHFLVSGTDTIPDHAGHDRGRMDFFRQYDETVR